MAVAGMHQTPTSTPSPPPPPPGNQRPTIGWFCCQRPTGPAPPPVGAADHALDLPRHATGLDGPASPPASRLPSTASPASPASPQVPLPSLPAPVPDHQPGPPTPLGLPCPAIHPPSRLGLHSPSPSSSTTTGLIRPYLTTTAPACLVPAPNTATSPGQPPKLSPSLRYALDGVTHSSGLPDIGLTLVCLAVLCVCNLPVVVPCHLLAMVAFLPPPLPASPAILHHAPRRLLPPQTSQANSPAA